MAGRPHAGGAGPGGPAAGGGPADLAGRGGVAAAARGDGGAGAADRQRLRGRADRLARASASPLHLRARDGVPQGGQAGRRARRRPVLAVLRAARCSATGCGCASTPPTPASTSARWPPAGHLGGLAWAAPQAIRVLDAAGCDVVLVETVGVGQSEVEIAAQADTPWCCSRPGMGDGIQAAKAGILEIGDVYVVNKADRDGADATARELNHMLGLGEARAPGDWRPPIVQDRRGAGRGHRRGRRGAGEAPGVDGGARRARRAAARARGARGRDDRGHGAAGADRRPARRPAPGRAGRADRRPASWTRTGRRTSWSTG